MTQQLSSACVINCHFSKIIISNQVQFLYHLFPLCTASSSKQFLYISPHSYTAELRAEILNQNDKERDFREQLERQLNEEQRIRRKF